MALVKKVGKIAFLVGIIGALILGLLAGLGLFQTAGWLLTILILSGVVIGLLNITEQESVPMMVASLVVGAGAGVLGAMPTVGKVIGSVMTSLAAVVIPAAIIIAVVTIWKKAS